MFQAVSCLKELTWLQKTEIKNADFSLNSKPQRGVICTICVSLTPVPVDDLIYIMVSVD